MTPKRITILGSTGTIGVNTLALVDKYSDRFDVVGLVAGSNVEKLVEQIKRYCPTHVSVMNEQCAENLKEQLQGFTDLPEIFCGQKGAETVAAKADAEIVVSAIVGFAGVKPTLAAILAGKDIALANKEAVVASGDLILNPAKEKGVRILPVDSEHSAIFQALHGNLDEEIKKLNRLILTSSGGPFLHTPKKEMANVTVEMALKHPTWNMGAKITIDSATMMNKGLEVIEASRLFNVESERIKVQVHPESIIHSMIEYVDGSILAQLGITDMRGPISYALAYPERLPEALPSLDLSELGKLTFFDPDFDKFPCLRAAFIAAEQGGSLPVVLNAANEICVASFLDRKIGFGDIPKTILKILEQHVPISLTSIDDVVALDSDTRILTRQMLGGKVKQCQT